MSENSKAYFNRDNIEKALIALIFVSVAAFFFLPGEKYITTLFSILTVNLLLVFYIYTTPRNLYYLFFIAIIIAHIPAAYPGGIDYLDLVGVVARFVLGSVFIYKSVKSSIANKNFELLSFLLGVFLVIFSIPLYFLNSEDFPGLSQLYHFGLCFVACTIMYNENLWDQYNTSEKKIIIYLLIVSVIEIINISVKFL